MSNQNAIKIQDNKEVPNSKSPITKKQVTIRSNVRKEPSSMQQALMHQTSVQSVKRLQSKRTIVNKKVVNQQDEDYEDAEDDDNDQNSVLEYLKDDTEDVTFNDKPNILNRKLDPTITAEQIYDTLKQNESKMMTHRSMGAQRKKVKVDQKYKMPNSKDL